jgi:isopenicillin-N epimerase
MAPSYPQQFRTHFQLREGLIYLNHGSFGACPRPVFDTYQYWQRELERQPVEFLARRYTNLMAGARQALADHINASPDDVVFFTNPTTALNMVARSLINRQIDPLVDGDEILATDHEYGALNRTWLFLCRKKGLKYIQHPVPLPVSSHTALVDHFCSRISDRTRVIFISHISSPTALTFPVKEVCRIARNAGILTIIDGAHAPGQLPLDMADIGADFYAGACHKWLMSPKGASFLYVRKEVQDWLEPLVVSWGYDSDHPSGSTLIDHHEWQGTRDLAAFLSVPAAIDFHNQEKWKRVRQYCHQLAVETRARLLCIPGITPTSPTGTGLIERPWETWFQQMFSVRLPDLPDPEYLQTRLYDMYQIEVPVIRWTNNNLLRVSLQGYNEQSDTDTLVEAVQKEVGLYAPS